LLLQVSETEATLAGKRVSGANCDDERVLEELLRSQWLVVLGQLPGNQDVDVALMQSLAKFVRWADDQSKRDAGMPACCGLDHSSDETSRKYRVATDYYFAASRIG
jgi:hypothetical protein